MKLQLFILCLLKYLILTSQEEGEDQMLTAEEFHFDMNYFNSIFNLTVPTDEGEVIAAPCSAHIPGFSGLGMMFTYIIVFLFAVIGNGVVLYVVINLRKVWSSTDIYLMHLAVADLLFCLTLPFWAVDAQYGWIFGNFLCKLLSTFQEASVYCCVFILACISVDRYFAIVRATHVLPSHLLAVKVVCCVVWLVATLLSLPMAIQRESMDTEDLGQTICYENLSGESNDRWRVILHCLRHSMGFFLPLVVMVICYSRTVGTLCQTRNQQKYKAMRVILAVVLAFILCWLPYNVTMLIDTLVRGKSLIVETCETRYTLERMQSVTQVLAFMHCAVNPVLYAFIGEKFRNQLLLTLYRRGLISQRLQMAYRKSSVNSIASSRSRTTSLTTHFI